MKVAILFWGLVRSLKFTIDSLEQNVFKVLRDNNIQYDKFIHCYYFNRKYTNNRASEFKIDLDADEYKLLDCDYVERDNQDKVAKKLKLNKYRSKKDPWHSKYQSVDFFILSMYSKLRVTRMVQKTNKKYDYLLFLRHDVQYLNKFEIKWFKNIKKNEIYVPNFCLKHKMNDRMALVHYSNGLVYGNLFKHLYKYSKKNPLHSETFHYRILHKLIGKLKIKYIDFFFRRIRANGSVFHRDKRLHLRLKKSKPTETQTLDKEEQINDEEKTIFENSRADEEKTDENTIFRADEEATTTYSDGSQYPTYQFEVSL